MTAPKPASYGAAMVEIERLRLQNRKLKLAVIVLLIGGTASWIGGLVSRSDGSSAGCQQSQPASAAAYQEGPPLGVSPALFRNPKGPTPHLGPPAPYALAHVIPGRSPHEAPETL